MIRSSVLAVVGLAVLATPLVSAAKCYGPAGRTDTLWLIALRLRADPSISPQRMMLALLKANPEAFSSNNVNALKAGQILCFEPSDAVGFDEEAAFEEVRRHNREWRSSRASGGGQAAAVGAASESRPASDGRGIDPPASDPESSLQSSGQTGGLLSVADTVAAFESRLAEVENRIETLGSEDEGAGPTPDPELVGTVQGLEAAYRGVARRLEHSEREIERLRATLSDSRVEDELADLRSRLAGMEAAIQHLQTPAPASSVEASAASLLASRLDEDLARLAARVSRNEDRIRVLIALLEAENEAIEVVASRLRQSLRLISSVSSAGGGVGEPAPSSAPQGAGAVRPMPTPAPQGAGAMEPMPTPAPQGAGAMEPMPTPAPQGAGAMEPMPTPAPQGAGAMEPMPTPAPQGAGAMEPMPTPAPQGAGAMEPMPTPAPQGAGAMEPMPTPAPQGAGAMEPMPTPAPQGAGAMEPMPTPAPQGAGAMEPMPTPAPQGAGAMEPMPTPAPQGVGAMEPMPTPAPQGVGAMEPMPTPAPQGAGAMEPMPTPAPQGAGVATPAPVPSPRDPEPAGPGQGAEPEDPDYVEIISRRVSGWIARIRDWASEQ